jgi:hypothetical protein
MSSTIVLKPIDSPHMSASDARAKSLLADLLASLSVAATCLPPGLANSPRGIYDYGLPATRLS